MNLQEKRDLFMEELEKLYNKYNACISTGCGCCSAGIYIDNHEVTDNDIKFAKIEASAINEN